MNLNPTTEINYMTATNLLIQKVQGMIGRNVGQLINEQNDVKLINELRFNLQQRKGSLGIIVEQLVTGTRGNTENAPDVGGNDPFDIKAIRIKNCTKRSKYSIPSMPTFSFKENLRIAALNYNDIQTTSLQDSSLWTKRKMLVILLDSASILEDSVIVGSGWVDLSQQLTQCQRDYDIVKQLCQQGRADELRSKVDQLGKYLKVYSSGSGDNTRTYQDVNGVECTAKGKDFYLYKKELIELYQPL